MRYNPLGVRAVFASSFFLGLMPILGKQAILLGMPPLAVVALRTILASVLMLAWLGLFGRAYFYIYPAGLLGCLLAGAVNGLGSLLYYTALSRIDAGLGQLLYSLYPLFVMLWSRLDRQPPSRLTLVRLVVALAAVYLLLLPDRQRLDWLGAGLMIGSALLYALHLPINQKVLYDMPAPTVTVYTLLAMSAVVGPAFLLSNFFFPTPGRQESLVGLPAQAWSPVLLLALATFFSRLTLFLGVKHLGGMQAALLGLAELLVAMFFAHLWLGEQLTGLQWAGAALLVASLILVRIETPPPHEGRSGGDFRKVRPEIIP